MIITMILIFVVGGILSGINFFLSNGSMETDISFKLKWLLDALRAGIFEEIVCRLFLFAVCILIIKNESITKL